MKLAARYQIPSSVSEGILTHHGSGIMRYFYDRPWASTGKKTLMWTITGTWGRSPGPRRWPS